MFDLEFDRVPEPAGSGPSAFEGVIGLVRFRAGVCFGADIRVLRRRGRASAVQRGKEVVLN